MPTLKSLNKNQLVKNNDVSLRLTQQDGDGFLDVLWNLLSTNLGAHDLQGLTLMATMFSRVFKKNNPKPKKENNERPSVGIKVKVQLKTEGFPR